MNKATFGHYLPSPDCEVAGVAKRAVKVTLIVEYEDGSRSEQGFFHLGKPFEFELIVPKQVEAAEPTYTVPRYPAFEDQSDDLRRRFGPP